MVVLAPSFLILTTYIGWALADQDCYYVYSYYRNFQLRQRYGYLYCSGTCCGYYYDRSCCTSGGSIAGAVIGCMIFVAFVVFVIFLIKSCNRTQTGVVVANHNPRRGEVTVVTTNTHVPPAQTNTGPYPPPGHGSNPGGSYPPPGPGSYPGGSYPPPGPGSYPGGGHPPPQPAPGSSNPGANYYPPPPPYEPANSAPYPLPPKY
ncbi:formin-B-like [Pecten maximus]|uniref:formin-B-like n=1 Tax=Pecten maximus TaxID=6579 RepID=UPI001458048B|nr:formin-B-like [Pecten maximus]